MRFLIGCSGVIALVAFIIGFVAFLFISDATWADRLTIAAMPAIITFVAALLLASRDSARHSSTVRKVRAYLLACNDSTDEQFMSPQPCDDAALLLETRKAISRFFDVPTVKVTRDVHLIRDLHVDKIEPSFQFYVVDSVIASQQDELKPFGFAMAGLAPIDDLTNAIHKVLDGRDRNDQTEDECES